MQTTKTYDFDRIIPRRGTDSAKYSVVAEDVLPLWVADMDFESPREVVEALRARVEHGIFGYAFPPNELYHVLVQRMKDLYNWQISKEQIVFIPGVVVAFNNAIRALGQAGDNFIIHTPVYPPFVSATGGNGQVSKAVEMIRTQQGNRLHYEIDFDAFEAAIDANTRAFLLCSPHNPVGRVWTKQELTRIAEICEKHDIAIISDEIHCDLIMEGHKHIPTASLSPEISKRTITLMAPSKTFNIPGLNCAFAIIQDPELRRKFQHAEENVVSHVGITGYTSALAAYQHGHEWLREVLDYIKANRDYTTQFVEKHLPSVNITHPEGTYLSWLDCRQFASSNNDAEGVGQWIEPFFLKEARVALNSGALFGESGKGYARLNFACPRPVLVDALERMRDAVEKHNG